MRAHIEKLERDARAFKREAVEKVSALASAAFGVVAALAWNNAIQAIFKRYYPAPNDPSEILPLIGYALVVSIVGVLSIVWIGRVSARLKREHQSRQEARDAEAAAQQGAGGKGARA